MDEDLKQEALNEGEENTVDATPAPEQTTDEVTEPESTETGEETESEMSEEPKKGFQARVRELNTRAKIAEERAESLAQKLAAITGSVEPNDYNSNQTFTPQLEPGAELSQEQYQQHVLKAADGLVTLRLKQSEARNRINNEANEVIREFPELDPDSENFNKDLSDAVTESVEAYIRNNPYSASVKQHVAKLMKPYKGAVAKEVGKASENIAKQVSQTALRPTTIRKQEKTAGEKSIAELEKELGIQYS